MKISPIDRKINSIKSQLVDLREGLRELRYGGYSLRRRGDDYSSEANQSRYDRKNAWAITLARRLVSLQKQKQGGPVKVKASRGRKAYTRAKPKRRGK